MKIKYDWNEEKAQLVKTKNNLQKEINNSTLVGKELILISTGENYWVSGIDEEKYILRPVTDKTICNRFSSTFIINNFKLVD